MYYIKSIKVFFSYWYTFIRVVFKVVVFIDVVFQVGVVACPKCFMIFQKVEVCNWYCAYGYRALSSKQGGTNCFSVSSGLGLLLVIHAQSTLKYCIRNITRNNSSFFILSDVYFVQQVLKFQNWSVNSFLRIRVKTTSFLEWYSMWYSRWYSVW